MSLIKNLVKETEYKPQIKKKKSAANEEEHDEEVKPRPIIKSATDLQRLKLEKLMKNPDKPVHIPEAARERDHMQTVPSFVRNVMGSSAGAGSGEFHVYRHLRRKEYARQKTIQAKSIKELLDDEYQQKLENNRRLAEEKTAKKRAKRLKKKQRAVRKPNKSQNPTTEIDSQKDDTSDDNESESDSHNDHSQNVNEEEIVAEAPQETDNNECNAFSNKHNENNEQDAKLSITELPKTKENLPEPLTEKLLLENEEESSKKEDTDQKKG